MLTSIYLQLSCFHLCSCKKSTLTLATGMRLAIWRSWFRIPAPYTGKTSFTVFVVNILMLVCRKDENKQKETGMAHLWNKVIPYLEWPKKFWNVFFKKRRHKLDSNWLRCLQSWRWQTEWSIFVPDSVPTFVMK